MKKETQKNFTVLLLFLLLFIIAACGIIDDEEDTESHNDQPYDDGTYTGRADPWEYGSEEAIVKIVSGDIDEITLRRLDTDGEEVDYDNWTGEEIDGQVYPNLMEYRKTLAEEMIEEQTYDVDSISGATISSDNWKDSVKWALQEASSDEDTE